MKTTLQLLSVMLIMACTTMVCSAQQVSPSGKLKLHAIFTDHMVVQRDKPTKVWGWGKPGETVKVVFGEQSAEAKVANAAPVEVFGQEKDYAGLGRWEVTFEARGASAEPSSLLVSSGGEKLQLSDILIGDVWVLYGQSNMAFPLGKTLGSDVARVQADIPLLRHFKIQSNEQLIPQDDIRAEAVQNGGWEVSTPETAGDFSSIGYHFGANLQRHSESPSA